MSTQTFQPPPPPSVSSQPLSPSPFLDIPAPLQATQNFVAWRKEVRDGKPTKVPYDIRTGYRAESDNPSTWVDFQTALNYDLQANGKDGIGVMLHGIARDGKPGYGLDFDNVIHDGVLDPFVQSILEIAGNPYHERTPSDLGVRAFVFAESLPETSKKRKFSRQTEPKIAAEIYCANEGGRYLTVTGQHIAGNDMPVVADIELVHALMSRITDENFKKLWIGDTSVKSGDASAADAACYINLRVLRTATQRRSRIGSASQL
jgi:putative DNA primase/helicase